MIAWLRRLFAAPEPPSRLFVGMDPVIPRLGSGNLVSRAGTPELRAKYGPPHECVAPHPEAAKALGADWGAEWRCDCGKVYVFAYSKTTQGAMWLPASGEAAA